MFLVAAAVLVVAAVVLCDEGDAGDEDDEDDDEDDKENATSEAEQQLTVNSHKRARAEDVVDERNEGDEDDEDDEENATSEAEQQLTVNSHKRARAEDVVDEDPEGGVSDLRAWSPGADGSIAQLLTVKVMTHDPNKPLESWIKTSQKAQLQEM
jgi:hypothetical protein